MLISLLSGRSRFEVQRDVAALVGMLLQPSACVGAPGHDRQVVRAGFGKRRFDQPAADALAAKRFGDFGMQEVQPIAVELVLQPCRGPVHGHGELFSGGIVDDGLTHGTGRIIPTILADHSVEPRERALNPTCLRKGTMQLCQFL